jgi:signal transduction histidine kinase
MEKFAIICIDDEKTILDSLRIELEQVLGDRCLIEVAESGQEALEVLAELLEDDYEIAVAISDYIMPGIKGDELIKQIHSISPKTINIMLTGQANAEAIGNALNQGGLNRYIAKPWNPYQLSSTITELVYRYFQDRKIANKNAQLVEVNQALIESNQEQMNLICQLHEAEKRLEEVNRTLEAQVKIRTEELQQEVTERQRAETEAIRASQTKSNFLATMSHEIRTPMNGILGTSDLLATTLLSAPQQDLVETLRYSAESLLTIINSILDFSKLEAQEVLLEQIPFDLIDCVEAIVGLLAPAAEQKGIGLSVKFIHPMPTELIGDPSRLRQVLLNLVTNAIKFTSVGQVKVEISLEPDFSEGFTFAQVRFKVIDSGIGIAPEAQAKLFQPFTQAEFGTSREYGGTGLGLSIARQLVELMGGKIGFSSVPGQGSQFEFTAQFIRQDSHNSNLLLPQSSLQNRTLIILERDLTNRTIIAHYAQLWGMHIILGDRVSALQESNWDVGIADLEILTHLSGSSVTQAEIWQGRWIATTSASQREKAASILEQTFIRAYLTKPIRLARLLGYLVEAVSDRSDKTSDKSIDKTSERQTDKLTDKIASKLTSPETHERATSTQKPVIQSNIRILIIEDNPVNRKVVLRQLESLGYGADCADNGQSALLQLKQQDYDILLMDCQMPVMDGYETTKHIRTLELEKQEKEERELKKKSQSTSSPSIKIIGLTANAMEGDRAKCIEAGMDDYLSKPVRIERLGQAIAKWLPEIKCD